MKQRSKKKYESEPVGIKTGILKVHSLEKYWRQYRSKLKHNRILAR